MLMNFVLMRHYRIVCSILMLVCISAFISATASETPDTLSVPAFTAYVEPDPNAVPVSEKNGVSHWTKSDEKIVWYGKINTPGKLNMSVSLRLKAGGHTKLKMSVAGSQLNGEAKAEKGDTAATIDFGPVEITQAGYVSFTLEGVEKDGPDFGTLDALILSGPAIKGAEFNLKPRRNAASVHLGYPLGKDVKAEWFYNEVTVRVDPVWSYFQACGFARGYFGIQVNSPTERRVIFSIWDSGNEAVDRKKTNAEDRVQLMDKGEGVVAGDFGNEGTGGHSHLVYNWEAGKTYRFLVHAKPDGETTVYSGYFYFPEKQKWSLIATFRAPKDGHYLHGLYSFSENFGGSNGNKRRLSEFGNQWIRTAGGEWQELLTARFTHDPTGKSDRHDYGAGLIDGRFYLSNGGFVADPIKYGDQFTRPKTNKPPEDAGSIIDENAVLKR